MWCLCPIHILIVVLMAGGCPSIGNLNYEHSPFAIRGVTVKHTCSDFILFLKCTLSIYSLLLHCWHHVSTIKYAWRVHWIELTLPSTWYTGGIPKPTTTRTEQWTAFQNLNCISEPNVLDRSKNTACKTQHLWHSHRQMGEHHFSCLLPWAIAYSCQLL